VDARAKIAIATAAKSLLLLRGETADAGERFRQAKRDRLHVRRRAGHSGHANARDRTSMATPPCNRLAAGQRQREVRGEIADSRGQWWRWRVLYAAISSASGRKAEAHRPPYTRRGSVNPGLLGSSFGHGSLVFLGLSEQGAHRYRGRADGE
jgi:hypothetical protein